MFDWATGVRAKYQYDRNSNRNFEGCYMLGKLVGNQIVVSGQGVALTYDKAGNRIRAVYGADGHSEDYV